MEYTKLGSVEVASGYLPLSFAQQRLRLLSKHEGSGPSFNIPFALRSQGSLNPGALKSSLHGVTRRHESLRTLIVEHDGFGCQVVLDADAGVLRLDHIATDEGSLPEMLLAAAKHPFDLSNELPSCPTTPRRDRWNA